MLSKSLLLARNEAINEWLNKNPLVLGLIFLAIGAVLLGTGIYGLQSNVTHDKYGNQISGTWGQILSVIRIIGGVGCCGFAIYKLIAG